jgi:putative CRISPR-associated protein (TIGR02619 family)
MNFYLSRKMVDEVYLYHTATGKGKFCAEILKAYLQEKGIRVNLVELKRLATPDKVDMALLEQIFEDGLVDLLDKVMSKAHELVEEGHEVYVNATGGLKPEVAMLPLASSLLPKPVTTYYIHERFREAISLPSLPLTISPRYQEVLRWLDEQRRMKGFATRKEFEDRWGPELLKDLLDRKLVIDDEGRIKLRGWTLVLLKGGCRLSDSRRGQG